MSLFNAATQAPADPILGLSTKFREDSRENKVNLGVGVFVDANGVTPVLPSVIAVEKQLAEAGVPLIVCQSFSKNFGLYQDRVAALHIVCADSDEATRVKSQVELCIRTNYSNPPAHGGAVVTSILNSPELTFQWDQELAVMRDRIKNTRADFVSALKTVLG